MGYWGWFDDKDVRLDYIDILGVLRPVFYDILEE